MTPPPSRPSARLLELFSRRGGDGDPTDLSPKGDALMGEEEAELSDDAPYAWPSFEKEGSRPFDSLRCPLLFAPNTSFDDRRLDDFDKDLSSSISCESRVISCGFQRFKINAYTLLVRSKAKAHVLLQTSNLKLVFDTFLDWVSISACIIYEIGRLSSAIELIERGIRFVKQLASLQSESL